MRVVQRQFAMLVVLVLALLRGTEALGQPVPGWGNLPAYRTAPTPVPTRIPPGAVPWNKLTDDQIKAKIAELTEGDYRCTPSSRHQTVVIMQVPSDSAKWPEFLGNVDALRLAGAHVCVSPRPEPGADENRRAHYTRDPVIKIGCRIFVPTYIDPFFHSERDALISMIRGAGYCDIEYIDSSLEGGNVLACGSDIFVGQVRNHPSDKEIQTFAQATSSKVITLKANNGNYYHADLIMSCLPNGEIVVCLDCLTEESRREILAYLKRTGKKWIELPKDEIEKHAANSLAVQSANGKQTVITPRCDGVLGRKLREWGYDCREAPPMGAHLNHGGTHCLTLDRDPECASACETPTPTPTPEPAIDAKNVWDVPSSSSSSAGLATDSSASASASSVVTGFGGAASSLSTAAIPMPGYRALYSSEASTSSASFRSWGSSSSTWSRVPEATSSQATYELDAHYNRSDIIY